jgi:lipopolysaccharide biosynthesis glycosyltransferase
LLIESFLICEQKTILIDGDMLVLQNMDELFSLDLPADWIAANHACVCNLDRAPWAPKDWLLLFLS